jgi:hypothetical protein
MLVNILDSLTLIRLRRTLLANFSCELSNLLLIGTGNDDAVGTGNLNGDSVDLRHYNIVREAEVHNEILALLLYTVTNTVNLKLLLEALGYTLNHVSDEGTGEAVKRAVLFIVRGTGNNNLGAFYSDSHISVEGVGKGSLGSLNGND